MENGSGEWYPHSIYRTHIFWQQFPLHNEQSAPEALKFKASFDIADGCGVVRECENVKYIRTKLVY